MVEVIRKAGRAPVRSGASFVVGTWPLQVQVLVPSPFGENWARYYKADKPEHGGARESERCACKIQVEDQRRIEGWLGELRSVFCNILTSAAGAQATPQEYEICLQSHFRRQGALRHQGSQRWGNGALRFSGAGPGRVGAGGGGE